MLTLEIVYTDADLIECVVSARSGAFAAAASMYFTPASLTEFATAIADFPSHVGDHREFATETLGDTFRLQLDTFEASGCCTAAVEITNSRNLQQSAAIRFAVYAGDVDSFAIDLRGLSKSEEGLATLGVRATSAV